MSLFNYGECPICEDFRNDAKVSLFHLFPAIVCEKISEFNVYCNRCSRMRTIEVNFLKQPHTKDCERVELQIRFFTFYNFDLFEPNDLRNERIEKMTKLIMDNACDDFKKMMVSYFKFRYREFKTFWLRNIGRKELLKERVEDSIGDCMWSFYNKECRGRIIIKLILYEYLLDLIGGDMVYIELDDIHKYLDDIFD